MDGDVFVCIYIKTKNIFCFYNKNLFILGYSFDKPDSMNDEKLKRQLEFHIAARQGPMSGLASKWDYETG